MASVYVCYGKPDDTHAFDDYYARVHAPLASKVPGVISFSVGRCQSLIAEAQAPYYMIAVLGFDSADARAHALSSPEMAEASADLANFADGGAVLFGTDEVDLWE